ncbi:Cardiolipin synthetase [Salipiger mucosus DSM 16094]|uniref:Cardiolipin synthase n=2 Tax=Salipiger mucosus TaxID=263378 RepID=S9S788_9RHOB|nr:Cardiolipin synthetase [Salipiger mucosus DSM 16094]
MTPALSSFLLGALALIVPVLVAYSAWRAVTSARTPQGAVAWVVFLLAAPWFALPAYAVFGQHKLRGYRRERQASREATRALGETDATGQRDDRGPGCDTGTGGAAAGVAPFEQLANLPATRGNAAELLIDGEATFDAIFAAIDRARDYVLVQFYTISDDDLGNALAERLKAASRRGVAVRVIYDGVGSYGLPAAYRARLEEAGVRILDPRAARGPTWRFQVNFRNHRKTVIVDGHEGFTGGHNVADLYMGRDATYGPWRDTQVALRGPMVAQLQRAFAEDWHWATGEKLGEALCWTPEAQPEDLPGLIVPSGPADGPDTGALFFFTLITGARERVWIASPYFVPDAEVLAALKAAALRGCDVRLLVPDMADHYLPWLAAHAYFDEIRAAGIEVYRYEGGFMHQKVILVDGDRAAVGTANLDNRSFRLNFETMALIFDEGFADRVSAMLAADMEGARRMVHDLEEQPLWVRLGAPAARLLAPVL